jgi:hypothetical protein
MYKLSKWFTDLNLPVSPIHISSNTHPGAIEFLQSNPEHMNWNFLSSNPCAMELLLANPDKINTDMLNLNPNALELISEDNVNWYWFFRNPELFKSSFVTDELILANICKSQIIKNKSMDAYRFISRNLLHFSRRLYYDLIAYNPFAFNYARHYEPHVLYDLNYIILSENPEAIELLVQNSDKIYWPNFCKNPAAIPHVQCNTDKITPSIWQNPGIFELDYQAMSIQRTNIILEDLMTTALHPSRIEYWLMNGMDIDDL